jgi:hypothetical protein
VPTALGRSLARSQIEYGELKTEDYRLSLNIDFEDRLMMVKIEEKD